MTGDSVFSLDFPRVGSFHSLSVHLMNIISDTVVQYLPLTFIIQISVPYIREELERRKFLFLKFAERLLV